MFVRQPPSPPIQSISSSNSSSFKFHDESISDVDPFLSKVTVANTRTIYIKGSFVILKLFLRGSRTVHYGNLKGFKQGIVVVQAVGFERDVQKHDDVERVLESTFKYFRRIDILVNVTADNFHVSTKDFWPNGF
ncbi:hypothetical protein Fmac_011741 [Flemingia macrophylla]|uniref:Uncharacterized protein n=1 Tax=Flemingia macrophylla TaxID=520843 RepID=A0ABD1MQD9_9FABA